MIEFTVPVDEKSHLIVKAEVREFEPDNKSWCVAARCRRYRGKYATDGLYLRGTPLGEEFEVIARGKSLSEALDALSRLAVNESRGS